MIRRPPRSTQGVSSAASDVYKRQDEYRSVQSVVEEAAPLKNVKAVKEGKIYYAPEDTYTNESIITYTEILNGLADAFEQA